MFYRGTGRTRVDAEPAVCTEDFNTGPTASAHTEDKTQNRLVLQPSSADVLHHFVNVPGLSSASF